jgi:hypothetical protein
MIERFARVNVGFRIEILQSLAVLRLCCQNTARVSTTCVLFRAGFAPHIVLGVPSYHKLQMFQFLARFL